MKTMLEARVVTYEAQILALQLAIDSGTTEIAEYRLDTGEGSQRVVYRSLDQMMDLQDKLYRRLDSVNRRLLGNGVVIMSVKRRGRYSNHGCGTCG